MFKCSVGKYHCSIFPRPMKVAHRIAFVIRIISPSFEELIETTLWAENKTLCAITFVATKGLHYTQNRIIPCTKIRCTCPHLAPRSPHKLLIFVMQKLIHVSFETNLLFFRKNLNIFMNKKIK